MAIRNERGTTVAGKRAETRRQNIEALTRAADRLFAEYGYQAVGIERIAEEAGLTTGAIYSTFGSKQALLLAVLDGRLDRAAAAAQPPGGGPELTVEEALAGYARAYSAEIASLDGRNVLRLELEALALALQDETHGRDLLDRIGYTRRHLTRLLAGRRTSHAGRPPLTSEEAAQLASAVAALLHGLALQAIAETEPPDPRAWADAACALASIAERHKPSGH